MTYLKNQMKEQIDHFVKKVNEPLIKANVTLALRYPEPTHENVLFPNSHRLLDMRDKFFECWDVGGARKPLFEALWRILIVKYEHSPPYRNMLDCIIMMIPKDWKPFNYSRQMRCWKGGLSG